MDSYHNSSHVDNDTFLLKFHCSLELDDNSRRVALFLLYLIPFMVGLAANIVVLWVNWKRRHSRSGVLFCLLNVTFSDLMVVLVLPFFMLEVVLDKVWVWGAFMCKFTHFVYSSNFYSSSFFLAYMTVERYKLIVYPNSRTWGPAEKWRRGLLTTGLWLLAIFLTLLENAHVTFLHWSEPGCLIVPESSYEEWFTSIFSLSFIFQFIFPAVIIISCNIYIAQALAKAAQRQSDVRLVHVYSAVFVLCWLPFHLARVFIIVDVQDPFLFSCDATTVIFISYIMFQCLSLFHCVANPILYNFLDQSFRKHLAHALVLSLRQYAQSAQPNPIISPEGMAEGPVSAKKEQELSNTSTSHSTVNP